MAVGPISVVQVRNAPSRARPDLFTVNTFVGTVCSSPGTSRAFRVTSLNISKTSDGRAYDFRERIAENGARVV